MHAKPGLRALFTISVILGTIFCTVAVFNNVYWLTVSGAVIVVIDWTIIGSIMFLAFA